MAVGRHIICKVDEIPEGEGKSFKFDDVSVAVFRLEKIYMLWKMDAVTQVSLFLGVTYTKKNYASHVLGMGLNLI